MISKFSVLYVGFNELEDVGLAGTPADQRRYALEHMASEVMPHFDPRASRNA